MRVVRRGVSPLSVSFAAIVLLLIGGALGRCSRQPGIADHLLAKRVGVIEDRLHKIQKTMAEIPR